MAKKKKKQKRNKGESTVRMSYVEEGLLRYETGQRSDDFDYADMEIARYMWEMEEAEERDPEKDPVRYDFEHPQQPWLPFTPLEIRRIKRKRGRLSDEAKEDMEREKFARMFPSVYESYYKH